MPGSPVLHCLPELAQTHGHRVSDASNHLILCCPCLLPPSIFPSIRIFSKGSVLCIGCPKYWTSVLPMTIQGCFPLGLTGLISLLSKEFSRVFSSTTILSINLQCSAFFMVQFSQPYMTTGKKHLFGYIYTYIYIYIFDYIFHCLCIYIYVCVHTYHISHIYVCGMCVYHIFFTHSSISHMWNLTF